MKGSTSKEKFLRPHEQPTYASNYSLPLKECRGERIHQSDDNVKNKTHLDVEGSDDERKQIERNGNKIPPCHAL